jgi:hypothetical protein
MTPNEWDLSRDRNLMLVSAHTAGRLSNRVLRLFACACCRRVASLFEEKASRVAVETAELFAADGCGAKRLAKARNAAMQVAEYLERNWRWRHWREWDGTSLMPPEVPAARAAAHAADEVVTVRSSAFTFAVEAQVRELERAVSGGMSPAKARRRWPFLPERVDSLSQTVLYDLARHQAAVEQCDLLREVAGNPFRQVAFEPGWLRWNGGWLPRLARSLFDANRFDELPIIGDALEDLGCRDEAVLNHCRSPGPHVRGCWVVRLLLGLT